MADLSDLWTIIIYDTLQINGKQKSLKCCIKMNCWKHQTFSRKLLYNFCNDQDKIWVYFCIHFIYNLASYLDEVGVKGWHGWGFWLKMLLIWMLTSLPESLYLKTEARWTTNTSASVHDQVVPVLIGGRHCYDFLVFFTAIQKEYSPWAVGYHLFQSFMRTLFQIETSILWCNDLVIFYQQDSVIAAKFFSILIFLQLYTLFLW